MADPRDGEDLREFNFDRVREAVLRGDNSSAIYARFCELIDRLIAPSLQRVRRSQRDDTAQNIRIAIWRSLDRIHGDPVRFVRAVARNETLRGEPKNKHKDRPITDELIAQLTVTPKEADEAWAISREIRQLIDGLSPTHRFVLLSRLEGATFKDIAAAAGITVNTAILLDVGLP